jgi:PPOX class probable F420-dependent enzyme
MFISHTYQDITECMINDNNKIKDPSVRRLFEGKNYVFVSTLMEDGTPQITPTWVDLEEQDGGHILVNTAVGRVKQKNVSQNPNIALAIIDQNNPYDMVSVRGKVVEQVEGDAAEQHIDKLAKKYLGKDKYPGRSPGERRIILKIKPKHIFHMKF